MRDKRGESVYSSTRGMLTKENRVDLGIVILILALLLAIAWLMRKRSEQALSDPKSNLFRKSGKRDFHGVSIIFSDKSCAAARELSGQRFLATAAPKLPLSGCDVGDCTCRFQHHEDRRTNKDRRNPFSPGIIGSGDAASQSELRDDSGRRNKDSS